MLKARILADLIVLLHAAYASFIVVGLALILAGVVFRWSWVRNFWFRAIHLTAIGFVVAEEFIGMTCPLTDWEKQLRTAAGQASYPGEFLGYWAHRLLFGIQPAPWVFTVVYIVFGLGVLAAFVLAPPRWPGKTRGGTRNESDQAEPNREHERAAGALPLPDGRGSMGAGQFAEPRPSGSGHPHGRGTPAP
jgi:hypothetical protein